MLFGLFPMDKTFSQLQIFNFLCISIRDFSLPISIQQVFNFILKGEINNLISTSLPFPMVNGSSKPHKSELINIYLS